MTLSSAKTVQGQEAAIQVSVGSVKIAGANVTKADIACNGVIHVIDAVMLPK